MCRETQWPGGCFSHYAAADWRDFVSRLQLHFSLALICLGAASCSSQKKAPAPPPPKVVVAPVAEKTIPQYADYVGQTAAVNAVEVRSQVTGFLQKVAFREGSIVQPGQLLFVIDPAPFEAALDQARGVLGQNEASLEIARQNVARYRPLVELHAISRQQLDTAIAAEKQAVATVASARAQVATAQLNLGYTKISAAIRGQIGTAQVKVGALVQSGTTLLDTIYSINPIYVTFSVSEGTYLQHASIFTPSIKTPAAPVRLTLAQNISYPYAGRIDMVSPNVNTATGVLGLRAVFPNPRGFLKPGLFVRVRMLLDVQKNALLVPKPAVQELQGVQTIDVVGPDNKVQVRRVVVSRSYGQFVVVTSGVSKGERVIVEGAEKVRSGMVVRPVEQPAPAAG